MKNKFVAAPLAGALLAVFAAGASAQSQVTVYGIAAMEAIRSTNVYNGATGGTQYRLDNSPVTSSRLGFRGSEDLGGGLRAIFDVTHGIALDTGSAASTKFWNRGSWVGLAGPWGTLTAGRHWNVNDDIMGNYFVFGGYSVFRFTEFDFISDLVDNSVKYVSPDMGGFQGRVLFGLGEGVTGRTWEAALNYAAGPLSIGASTRRAKNLAGQTDKLDSIGASYKFGPVRVHGGWSVSDSQASGFIKAHAWDIGAAWDATSNVIAAIDYVARDQKGTNNDSHFVRLQADYLLSKRSTIFGNLISLKNKGTASERFFGTGSPGIGQNVVTLGIRHVF